jgi:ectoine hydroxylase-related dioxygenase (phytanoyl-CoA dioxygenase family)
VTDESVLAHTRALLGTRDILLHFCNVTMKRSRVGSGIYFHRDYPNGYLTPRSVSCLRVMVCLDGMSAENGATVVRAGSHIAPAEGPPTRDAVLAAPLERVLCPPGSLVFIHPLVLHGGPPNPSASHRRNVVMQWGRRDDPVTGPGGPETLTNFSPAQIRAWARARAVSA